MRSIESLLTLGLCALLTACGGASQARVEAPPGATLSSAPPPAALALPEQATRESAMVEMTVELPPEDLVHAVGAMWASLDYSRLSSDSPEGSDVVDINRRPVHVFIAANGATTGDVYVMGHADGECCPKVSQALAVAGRGSTSKEDWMSYGVSVFHAGKDAARSAALTDLASEITRLSTQPACVGQIRITRMSSDRIAELSARAASVSGAVLTRAVEAGRPIGVHYDLDDHLPRIVAPVGMSSGGAARAVDFEIDLKAHPIPDILVRSATLDGGITQLRENLAELDKLIAAQAEARKLDGGLATRAQSFQVIANYRGDLAEKVSSGCAAAKIDRDRTQIVARVLGLLGKSSREENERVKALEKAIKECPSMLKAAGSLGILPGPARVTITYNEFEVSGTTPFVDLRTFDFESSRTSLEAELALLSNLAVVTVSSNKAMLIDAMLRGWPATFSNDAAEKQYDRWVKKERTRVWSSICAGLARDGINLGRCADGNPGPLARSNVFFSVSIRGDVAVARPFYVLGGESLQVADPTAHLLWYESAHADQHLFE